MGNMKWGDYKEWLPGCGGVETKVSDVGLQH